MVWRDVSIVDQRQDFVMLASCEGANVAELCRRFDISRQTGYLWLRRFSGLEALADRSRRPFTSPRRSPFEIETAVLAVRDAHPAWGARKICACLRQAGMSGVPAPSTVHAVLKRHGRIAPDAGPGKAYERFEKEAPNLLWQMDFKGRLKLSCGRWCHTLTVIDDHSRFAVALEACGDERADTVQARLEKAFRHNGLPCAIYVDNGSPWGCAVPGRWTCLTVWLLKLGIHTLHARPYHPQARGKNERFHRTLKAEVFSLATLHGLDQAQQALDRWRHVYNRERPHQALDFKVPASRYTPSVRSFPKTLPQPDYAAGEILRRVGTTKAYISFKDRLWPVPSAFLGETVALRPRARDGRYSVCFGATQIATIDLNAQPNV